MWFAGQFGPLIPLVPRSACCPERDVSCRNAGDDPSAECQAQVDADRVATLRDAVSDAGAGNFELHVMHLAADEDEDIVRRLES